MMRASLFILGHMSLNTLANICFKLSSAAGNVRHFALWQIAGNLAGFLGILAYTGLLRHVPLYVAFPLTQGLAVLGVQLVAARLVFQEAISPLNWLGTALIVAGIILVSFRP